MKTLLQFVYDHERSLGERTWLTQPMGGGVVLTFTWKEALDEARGMAAFLQERGYPPGSRIAILSKNCAWWFLADLSIWMAGHVSVPVHPALSAGSVRAILDHSEARLVFIGKVEPFTATERWMPDGVDRVAFPGSPTDGATAWDDILRLTPPLVGEPDLAPDALATIIYTSGSTGAPKGVMHSFRTMAHSRALCDLAGITSDDRFVSYLPLAHVAERALLEATSFIAGFSVWFIEGLKTFAADVSRAQPTVFGSVPRLWMQFQAGVFAKLPAPRLERLLRLPIIGHFVRRKIRRELGLARTRVAFYGSAPTPPELVAWYRSLGLELLELYGMTEDWGISHMGRVGQLKSGWIGPPVPGVEQRLTDEGEVLLRSPGLMLGYYRAPELTRDVIDEDGWFHTGDRGEIDEEGRLRITGRVKDLFKTSKGKYVAPAPIENRLLAYRLIEQACVSGSSMPQPYALVVLSSVALVTASGALERELAAIREELNTALDPHERLVTLVITREAWTVENGLLTPTLKLKRSAIEDRYAPFVQEWYDSRQPVIRER